MAGFLDSITTFVDNTHVLEQIRGVDAPGLFTNPYFLLPFLGIVGYMVYKQAINNLIFIGTGIGVWIFTGSEYAQDLMVDGQIQVDKIIPVMAVGVVVIAIVVYILFIRSD